MRRWDLAALVVLAIIAGCSDVHSHECGGLSACIQPLRDKVQVDDRSVGGMVRDADTLKRGILADAGAVEALVPLLKDPDQRVAELAAYMLRDAPAIDPAYLPDIIEGLDRDLGSLAPALARMFLQASPRRLAPRIGSGIGP